MTEEFRPIPGFPGYQVSDLGMVVSYRSGRRVVRVPSRQDGYLRLMLHIDGVHHKRGVHQLVALAFIGPCPDGQEVRHLDNVRDNNVPSNLAYGTRSDNMRDALVAGTHNQASKTHCPHGHEYTPENTGYSRTRAGGMQRVCRKCGVVKTLRSRARRLAREKETA